MLGNIVRPQSNFLARTEMTKHAFERPQTEMTNDMLLGQGPVLVAGLAPRDHAVPFVVTQALYIARSDELFVLRVNAISYALVYLNEFDNDWIVAI